jgi:plasmid maintenance system antidote protein VapI
MENKEIRRRNFRYLADKLGRDSFAEKCGWDGVNYVNGICAGHSKVGDATARRVESCLDLSPVGWLDLPHPELWGGKEIEGYDPELAASFLQAMSLPDSEKRILITFLRSLAQNKPD